MVGWGAILVLAAAAQEAGGVEFFESRVRPILAEHCLKCHGDKKPKGALRLDSRAGWEKGGDSGPAIVPKRISASLLVKMIRSEPGSPAQMPPERPMPASAVADLVKWVEMGAPDPRTDAAPPPRSIDWKAAAQFWSFRPLQVVDLPIDRLVDAKLAEKGLTPVAKADRWTLLRRATYDLTGLPPTPEEAREFLPDASPDAFARAVDRLLASPAYGEHQARLWLDLARYAEDQAHVTEGRMSHAWRYRDWVVEAFNRDVPYDRFVKLQLAADLMETAAADPADRRALGFLGLGAIYARPNDLDRARAEQWDDRVDTLTRSFLGLTVACARCHDHKFDPIPTVDYYSLTGIIASSKDTVLPVAPRDETARFEVAAARSAEAAARVADFLQAETDRRALEKAGLLPEMLGSLKDHPALEAWLRKGAGRPKKVEEWEKLSKDDLAALLVSSIHEMLAKSGKQRNLDFFRAFFGEKGIFPLTEKIVLGMAAEEWRSEYAWLQAVAHEESASVPPDPARCHGVADVEKPADLKVYIRGNPAKHGEAAPRRFLRILAGTDSARFTHGSGRLELAEAIVDPANPLTARVLVNRIWQQHFGRGIVATPSNFGALGARPTHPELLDALAGRFIKGGWSIKRLHREILLCDTWQRGSASDAKNEAVDPENQWLWRVSRRRLTIEEFRDSILMVSGGLDRSIGGPSLEVEDPKNVRRTLYGKVSRMDLAALLRLFDFPDPNLTAERRTETTLPQQSLYLLNSPFMIERAKALAARVASEPTPEATVRRAYDLVFARPPGAGELAAAAGYLAVADTAKSGLTRVERFAQALLASNLLLFVD